MKVKPESAYWLNFAPDESDFQHEFAGSPDIPGAHCSECNRPLLRILSLSTKDKLLELEGSAVPFLHLLYCWTCSIPIEPFSYQVLPDGSVEILERPTGKPAFGLEGPYEGYTGKFPLQCVSLQLQTVEESMELQERWYADFDLPFSDLFQPRHQIGGIPFIYNPETRKCPRCANEMALFASICDDASGNDPWQEEEANSFAGNGGVQMIFLLCEQCLIIAAYHSCD